MIFYDPKGFLKDHALSVNGQIYANILDVIGKNDRKIALLDYLSEEEPDREIFDLIIWYTLENFHAFKSRLRHPEKELVLSPNIGGVDFCLTNWIYCTSDIYKKYYIKPNLSSHYLATMLIGRISSEIHITRTLNRAWAYYEFLNRGSENNIIATVRDCVAPDELSGYLDANTRLGKDIQLKIERFGGINPSAMPNYDHYESPEVRNLIEKKFNTNEIFDKGPNNNHLFSQRNLIPTEFYRNSFLDIVLQDYNQPGTFIDEKIAKPIIMGRPFLVIGPRYYLRDLRSLGFQTFDPIIDESYDEEPDPVRRWSMVYDQIRILQKSNRQSMSDRLRKRLQHNRKFSYNSRYWISKLKTYLNSAIEKHTGQKCVIY